MGHRGVDPEGGWSLARTTCSNAGSQARKRSSSAPARARRRDRERARPSPRRRGPVGVPRRGSRACRSSSRTTPSTTAAGPGTASRTEFLPLAHKLARRYRRSSEPDEDLAQVAVVGLLKALDRFDPNGGRASRPSRYRRSSASCDATSATRPGRRTFPGLRRSACGRSSWRSSASPRSREVADGRPARARISASAPSCPRRPAARHAYDADPLEAAAVGEDGEGAAVIDTLGDEDSGYALVEDQATIAAGAQAVAHPRERAVLGCASQAK